MPKPNKLLGQHFLISHDVLNKIISAADLHWDETILEIGPGHGILTRELASRVKCVIAVEKDQALAEHLEHEFKKDALKNVKIIRGDILKLPPRDLGLPKKFSVVANIPYYLTGRLIRLLLEREVMPKRIVLMVQKEVAERMVAIPPAINLLAISVQAYGIPKIEFFVSADAFSPRPTVDSALITIHSISEELFREYDIRPSTFFRIASRAFRGKRKILENTLATLCEPKILKDILKHLNIEKRRPQELGVTTWFLLAKAIERDSG